MKVSITCLLLALLSSLSIAQNQHSGTIKIGLLVSEDPLIDSISLSAVHGAELAISLLNADVELIVRSCDGPWGVTSKQMVDFIYEDEVDAIITSVDGRNAHLAEQVATKAHKSLISARATDPTLTQAFVPWFFRITPDDKKQAKVLKDEIFDKHKLTKVVVLYPSNYNGSYAMDHFIKELDGSTQKQTEVISYDPLTYNFQKIMKYLNEEKPQGVVFIGRSVYTSRLIMEVHREIRDIKLFGNQSIVENGETMSNLPDNLFVTSFSSWPSKQGSLFVERFYNSYGYKPGVIAAYAQDALNIFVNAIQKAGSEHNHLHEELKKTNYLGLSGTIVFEGNGNRSSSCTIGKLIGGKLIVESN